MSDPSRTHALRAGPRVSTAWRGNARSAALSRPLALVILLLPLALCAYGFWPGNMTSDSLVRYYAAQAGKYTDQHDPVFQFLWSLVIDHGLGPGRLLVLTMLTFQLGSYLLLRQSMGRLTAAIVAAVIAATPMVFVMLGYQMRDTQFAAAVLLSFGAVARARTVTGRPRAAWLVLAFAAGWMALSFRQNAAPAVLVMLVVLAVVALPGRRRRVVAGAAVAALVLMLGSQLVLRAALPISTINPAQYTMTYDLARLSEAENRNLFPARLLPDRSMTPIRAYTGPLSADSLYGATPGHLVGGGGPLYGQDYELLASTWRRMVARHPLDYLAERVEVGARVLSIGNDSVEVLHEGIDANTAGLRTEHPDANRIASDYIVFTYPPYNWSGSIIYRGWVYFVICLVAAVLLLRRSRAFGVRVVGAAAVGALLFQLTYVPLTPGVSYRLNFLLIAVGLIAGATLVTQRRRRAPA